MSRGIYVFWLSLNESSYGTDLVFVGLANYRAIFADPYFWRATVNTLVVVNAVVYAELLLGLGLALAFAGRIPFKGLFFAAILTPYAVSEVVGVLAWKILLNPNYGLIGRGLADAGLGLSLSTVPAQGLAFAGLISVWHHLPFTFLLLYAGLLAIPASLYEAARIDGASAWQVFWRITLPLLMPAILITLIFRLVFAFRMFSEVWLLTRGGPARLTEVLAVYLYTGAFRNAEFGPAAATGWMMVVGSLLIAAVYLAQVRKRMAGASA
ncbi:sugar ABC transporter permease [Leptolyngbya sp. 15MV]|nr:sugar ABC transporter permease [Leptolyngbya sp. 15MV]